MHITLDNVDLIVFLLLKKGLNASRTPKILKVSLHIVLESYVLSYFYLEILAIIKLTFLTAKLQFIETMP